MKHYHRNMAKFWSSDEYYQREWRKLDPQPGECFALFKKRDSLRALILCEKRRPGQNHETIPCQKIHLGGGGFQRSPDVFDVYDLGTYSYIVQIDPHRFHVLDKQIAMLNVQLNAYKCELEKLLTN